MSSYAIRWAWQQGVDQPMTKLVLVTLAWHHNQETGQCNPSIDRIASMTGLSRATIFRALANLNHYGLIAYERGHGRMNSYELKLDMMLPGRERSAYSKAKIPPALARKVMERDAYRCRHCATHIDLTCDHIIPEIDGGPTTFENLQTLCKSCNSKKGVSQPESKMSQPMSHDETTVSHEMSHGEIQNKKKTIEPEGTSSKRKRATRMTEDWQPDQALVDWAIQSFPILESINDETDRFRDHWISKGEARADWRASWRNWMRNAAKYAARSRPVSRLDGIARRNAQAIDAAMARHGADEGCVRPLRPALRLVE